MTTPSPTGSGRLLSPREYGVRKRNDFFVEHLLGVRPPRWNRVVDEDRGSGA